MSLMIRFKKITHQMFSRYLLITNTVTCGGLLSVGDAVVQHIESLDKKEKKKFDFKRTGRIFCLGFLVGPFNHLWYKVLDRYLPGAAGITVVKKILSDQAVAAPFFCSSYFMVYLSLQWGICVPRTLSNGMSLMEGKTVDESIDEVKRKFLTVYLIDWFVWPPAQFINFFFLPTRFRVAYVSTIALFWNAFLSWMKHKEHDVICQVK